MSVRELAQMVDIGRNTGGRISRTASRRVLQRTIVSHLVRNGARRISVFGSYARKQDRPPSDIDLVVRFKPGKSLLELVRIERELSEATGRRIDLLTEGGMAPGFMAAIKGEMEVLYG